LPQKRGIKPKYNKQGQTNDHRKDEKLKCFSDELRYNTINGN